MKEKDKKKEKEDALPSEEEAATSLSSDDTTAEEAVPVPPPLPEDEAGEEEEEGLSEEEFLALVEADLEEIRRVAPGLRDIRDLGALPDPVRFAELRELGLSVTECLRVVAPSSLVLRGSGKHLRPSVGFSTAPGRSDTADIALIKAIYPDLSDGAARRLWQKVQNAN